MKSFPLCGQHLKGLRESLKISQSNAGQAIGKSGQYVSNMERGVCAPNPKYVEYLVNENNLDTSTRLQLLETIQDEYIQRLKNKFENFLSIKID